ncbi:unnamed protein product [Calypogeia fissa]
MTSSILNGQGCGRLTLSRKRGVCRHDQVHCTVPSFRVLTSSRGVKSGPWRSRCKASQLLQSVICKNLFSAIVLRQRLAMWKSILSTLQLSFTRHSLSPDSSSVEEVRLFRPILFL